MLMTLLTGSTFLEKIGLTLVFFICLALLLLLAHSIFGSKPFSVSLFGSSFEFRGGLAAPGRKYPFHRNIGPETLVEIYSRTSATSNMVSLLKNKQILFEQMNYLEDMAILLREAFIASYSKCLSSFKAASAVSGATVVSSKEYHFFRSLMTLMVEDQKKICRQIFIQNNFSSLGEKEFHEYLEEKIAILQTKARLYVRELYPSDKMEVPYEVVESEVFGKTADIMAKNYEQVFRRAAIIYRSRHDEADALDAGLRTYLKAVYGADVEAPYRSVGRAPGTLGGLGGPSSHTVAATVAAAASADIRRATSGRGRGGNGGGS